MPMSDTPKTPAPAGAIAGIGMDLLRIDRIERALERHGDRFDRTNVFSR